MINDQEVMITGGTGSLGKALLKILTKEYKPHGIRIFSRDELKQWELKREVESWSTRTPIAFIIGDIRDRRNLSRAMQRVNIVINCAAMKQVPACEENPIEAVETNINGSRNIIDSCIDNGVSRCVHISTDKAVYPVNLYGKTKAVAESLFIHSNKYSGLMGTKFNCCRYGNVLGSRGSIIPLFREQAKSGEITITDVNMTRFWITLEKVAKFIIERFKGMSDWGKIYIPKMPSMKVCDLAEVVAPGSKIKDIGIRKGEKLHECLITREESLFTKEYQRYYEINPLAQQEGEKKSWTYTSDTNDWWLKKEDLKEIIDANNL